MKRCPQCNNVFPDGLTYCTHDGTPLVSENLTMPSEFTPNDDTEEDTVIRREPITIDFSGQNAPTEQINYGQAPPVEPTAPVVVVRQRNTGKYLLFLIIGLIFGGVLVLATLLLARNYYQGNTTAKVSNMNTGNSKANIPPVNVNREPKSPTPTPTIEPLNSEHQTKTDEDDSEFNGRVIVPNAYVRSSPSKTASQVDILPVNDRLHIERRENDESPWFYVTCEHGTSGWMHGNTIKYTE